MKEPPVVGNIRYFHCSFSGQPVSSFVVDKFKSTERYLCGCRWYDTYCYISQQTVISQTSPYYSGYFVILITSSNTLLNKRSAPQPLVLSVICDVFSKVSGFQYDCLTHFTTKTYCIEEFSLFGAMYSWIKQIFQTFCTYQIVPKLCSLQLGLGENLEAFIS